MTKFILVSKEYIALNTQFCCIKKISYFHSPAGLQKLTHFSLMFANIESTEKMVTKIANVLGSKLPTAAMKRCVNFGNIGIHSDKCNLLETLISASW